MTAHLQNGNANFDVSTNFSDNETSLSDPYDPLGLSGSEVEVRDFEFALFFYNISPASPEDNVLPTANEDRSAIAPVSFNIAQLSSELQVKVFEYAIFLNGNAQSPSYENVLLVSVENGPKKIYDSALAAYHNTFNKIVTIDNELSLKWTRVAEVMKIKHLTLSASKCFLGKEDRNFPGLRENFPKMIANIVTVKNNLKTVTIDLTNCYLISPNDPDSEHGPTEPRADLQEIFKTVGYICNASQCGVKKIFLKLRLPTEAMRLIWEKKSKNPLYLSTWKRNAEEHKWFSLGMLPRGSLGEVRFLDVGYDVFKAKGRRLERTAEYEAFSWEMEDGDRLLTVGTREYYRKKREMRTEELRS